MLDVRPAARRRRGARLRTVVGRLRLPRRLQPRPMLRPPRLGHLHLELARRLDGAAGARDARRELGGVVVGLLGHRGVLVRGFAAAMLLPHARRAPAHRDRLVAPLERGLVQPLQVGQRREEEVDAILKLGVRPLTEHTGCLALRVGHPRLQLREHRRGRAHCHTEQGSDRTSLNKQT
eukprot:7377083-Prymnesium_polylepis.2